jgi:hypothetical protein
VFLHLSSSSDSDYAGASFNGDDGNPTIQFDSSIGAKPNVLITLSASVATAVNSKYFATENVKMQEIVLTRDITSSICASLKEPGNPVNPVFALFNGVYWIHDPRFVSYSPPPPFDAEDVWLMICPSILTLLHAGTNQQHPPCASTGRGWKIEQRHVQHYPT